MKKILSVFVFVLVLTLSCAGALANEVNFPDVFGNSSMQNGEISFEFSIDARKIPSELIGIEASELEDFVLSAAGKFDYAEDMTKIKMDLAIEMDMAGETESVRAWYDIDFSDPQNPVMMVIMKSQYDEKYMYMDYSEVSAGLDGGTVDMLSSMAELMEMQSEIQERFGEIEIQEEVSDGVYTAVISQNDLLEIYRITADYMADFMKNYFMVSFGVDAVANEEVTSLINGFFAKLETVKLFADDAVVINATADENQNITTMDVAVNVQTNIAEIMEAFENPVPGITKENSEVDITLNLNYVFDKINEGVVIDFPVLTPENSIDLFAPVYPAEPQMEPIVIVIVNGEPLNADVMPIITEGRTMVPYRAFFNLLGVADEDITFSDDVVTVANEGSILQVTIGSTTAYVDGEPVILDVPAQIVHDRTLIPARFFAEGMGFTVEWHQFEEGGGIVNIY